MITDRDAKPRFKFVKFMELPEHSISGEDDLQLSKMPSEQHDRDWVQVSRDDAQSPRDDPPGPSLSSAISGLSNETQTQLNAIIGLSELLSEDKSLGESQRAMIDEIRRHADVLQRIHHGVVDYSRFEVGDPVDRRGKDERFDLYHTVFETTKAELGLADRTGELDVVFGVERPCPPADIVGQRDHLNNAIRHVLRAALQESRGAQLRMKVSLGPQSGIKDPPSADSNKSVAVMFQLTHLFDRGGGGLVRDFVESYRLSTLSRIGSQIYCCSDLDLGIFRRRVDAMGGQVWMQSSHNGGGSSTVSFTVPLRVAVNHPDAMMRMHEHVKSYRPIPRILFIDEGRTDAGELITEYANDVGFQYRILKQGPEYDAEIDNILSSGSPDCWDCCFVESVETAKDIRKDERLEDASILIVLSEELVSLRSAWAYNITNGIVLPCEAAEFGRVVIDCVSKKPRNFTRRLSILAAEDNAINQRVLTRFLAQHDATLAGDGSVAVGMFKKQKFDIVLMDTKMPVMV